MDTEKMASELQDAWPGLPSGLDGVLKAKWDQIAPLVAAADASGVPDGEHHPLNDFTIPLANLARAAGFQNDGQGKEFVEAAIEAAGVPEDLRSTVRTTFAVQLHFRGEE